jgi:hypothetical protein
MRIKLSLNVRAARAFGIGNLDRLVAVGEFQQHVTDAADRTRDGQHRKQRRANQHQHDEHADDERDGADTVQFGQQLGLTFVRILGAHADGLADPGADLVGGRKHALVEHAHLGFLGLQGFAHPRLEAIRRRDQPVDSGLDVRFISENPRALQRGDPQIGAVGDEGFLFRFGGGRESPTGSARGVECCIGLA